MLCVTHCLIWPSLFDSLVKCEGTQWSTRRRTNWRPSCHCSKVECFDFPCNKGYKDWRIIISALTRVTVSTPRVAFQSRPNGLRSVLTEKKSVSACRQSWTTFRVKAGFWHCNTAFSTLQRTRSKSACSNYSISAEDLWVVFCMLAPQGHKALRGHTLLHCVLSMFPNILRVFIQINFILQWRFNTVLQISDDALMRGAFKRLKKTSLTSEN